MVTPGICECGCGGQTIISPHIERRNGYIKDVPRRFIRYHRPQKETRPQVADNKNPAWAGGTCKYWGRQAKIRDDYTCQICGLRDPEIMEADHIIPKAVAPELKFELNNFVTLCPNCHRRKTNRELKNGTHHRKR